MADEKKNNPLPLIFVGLLLAGAIAFFLLKRNKPALAPPPAQELPGKDPCEGIPDWACATVSLLNPLAKASVDVYKAKSDSDVELSRIKAGRAY